MSTDREESDDVADPETVEDGSQVVKWRVTEREAKKRTELTLE